MARYLIRIRVDDLIVKIDDDDKEVVAFATRVAESSNPTKASEDVIERVRRELRAIAIMPDVHSPQIEVEAIDEIGQWSYRLLPPSGFTFSVWNATKDGEKTEG